MKKIIQGLILVLILVPTTSFASISDGCMANYKFSPITGKSCSSTVVADCSKGNLFSSVTGKPCTDNPINKLKSSELEQRLKIVEDSLKPKVPPPPSKDCLTAKDKFKELTDKMSNVQKDYENKIDKVKNIHTKVVKLQQSRFSKENSVYEKLKLTRNKIENVCDHLPKLPELPKRTIEKDAPGSLGASA